MLLIPCYVAVFPKASCQDDSTQVLSRYSTLVEYIDEFSALLLFNFIQIKN